MSSEKTIDNYIIDEWDYEKNAGVSPSNVPSGSCRKVWWKCSKCGCSWQARVCSRTIGGTGCPVCSKEQQQKSYKKTLIEKRGSLAEKYPKIANEWDGDENDSIPECYTPGSAESVWWKCSTCGHKWQARIYARTNGSGCPVCARKKKGKHIRKD